MTWSAKHRENTRLLQNYLNFLDECRDTCSRLKLCKEIARLQVQNEWIEKLTPEELDLRVQNITVEVTAILTKYV